MAIGTIPSWLDLPNFVQAMREGAATGLAARRQDTDEAQAADKLQLAYESLAEKEHAANELAQYRMTLESDRQQRAADALAQRTQAAEAIQGYREQLLQSKADALNKRTVHFGPNGEIVSADPAGNFTVIRAATKGTLDPISTTEMHEDVKDIHDIDKKLKNVDPTSQEAVDLMEEKYRARAKIAGYRKQLSPADAILRPSTPAAAATPSPKRVKVKNKDGKIGTIPEDQLDDALSKGYSLVQ